MNARLLKDTWLRQLQHLQLRELFQSQGLNPQDAETLGIANGL